MSFKPNLGLVIGIYICGFNNAVGSNVCSPNTLYCINKYHIYTYDFKSFGVE